MLHQFAIGVCILTVCVAAQSAMVVAMLSKVRRWQPRHLPRPPVVRASIIVGFASLWLTLVHGLAIVAWSTSFVVLGVFDDFDTAVYFSAVSFTTLGFGDIIPPDEWRQLAGVCAAHGLLVFGVSSAALVEIFRRVIDGAP